MNADELLRAFADGRRDFQNADLRGLQLIGSDLAGINLSHANLSQSVIHRTNFTEAQFAGAILSEVDALPLFCHNCLFSVRICNTRRGGARPVTLCASRVVASATTFNFADLRNVDLIEVNVQFADLDAANLAMRI
jgi:uncharacterized protein YjbI with pentapeptide repeats